VPICRGDIVLGGGAANPIIIKAGDGADYDVGVAGIPLQVQGADAGADHTYTETRAGHCGVVSICNAEADASACGYTLRG
jgi:hypothetical protein